MPKKITLLVLFFILFALVTPAHAQTPAINIYYAGEQDSLYTALTLAPEGTFTFVEDPAQADVFVINGDMSQAGQIAPYVEAGAGLVLVPGPQASPEAFQQLTGIPVELTPREDPVSLTEIKGLDDPLLTEIIWNGAPQVRERVETITPLSSVQPLVVTYETGEWMLWSAQGGRMFIFTPFLGEFNPQIQDWGYFNYLIYHLTVRAAGGTPLSFADYPASPVPHANDRNMLFLFLGILIITNFSLFAVVRRYSLRHPEALDELVANSDKFEHNEEDTNWENVGFHRPLGGFLLALVLGLILFIPLIIYQNLILPTYILPSAQALGIWGRVTQFFNLAWFVFDMGTSIAFVKYLSQYRVSNPRKGIQYGQFFVWWQILTGVIQVALVVGLASSLAPKSAYALYAWSVVIHAFIQVPGFYQVYRHTFSGLQRGDYSRLLDLSLQLIMPMLVQPVFVTLMYAWGVAHPQFGGSMGGLLGLGMAAYAAELLTFIWGWWLYRRLGLNSKVLFLAHFDGEIVKTSLKFGVFEMLGSAAWSAGQAAEIWITQARLVNYAEIWGNWGIAQNFIFAFNVTQTLNDGIMPAISEAISHGKKLLSQYYTVLAYKYNGMIAAFIAAVLLAVADRFILGATGPEFVRAAQYVIPLIIWGAIQFPSWVGDNVQLGSNKPYLKTILITSEQLIRIVLGIVLIGKYQINGLIIAYFVGLISKGVAAYIINNKYCFPQRFYWWQTVIAPFLAATAHFLVLRWLTGLIWKGDPISSIIIFFIGILPSFPLYMFFYGFFGGWDNDGLIEVLDGVKMAGVVRWLSYWGLYIPTRFGARISPLTGRFPISIRAEAMEEANLLTEEKVKLA